MKTHSSLALLLSISVATACLGSDPIGNYRNGGVNGAAVGDPQAYVPSYGHTQFTNYGPPPVPEAEFPNAYIADTSNEPVIADQPALFDMSRAIGLNVAVTEPLLDFQNRQTGKQLLVLDSQRGAACHGPHAYLGAQFRASLLVAETNSDGRFPYLGRFPTDFDGSSATDARLLQANQNLVAHANEWASGYIETLFSDVFTFPSFNQGSWQVRQAYVVVGNFDESPFYGWIGKKTLDFGDFGTLSPFTQAVPWHYFAALGEGVGVGYSDGFLHVTAAAVNAGRGIRVSDSSGIGNLKNFTLNSHVVLPIADDVSLILGGGYLHSTIYDGTTAEHINPAITGPRNGAWDVNGRLDIANLTLAGEFVSTVNDWPVVGHEVSAWRAEAAYRILDWYRPWTLSASFSEGIQGPDGSEFEYNRQFVLGARVDFSNYCYGTLEWVRSTGFAPLINITTVSNRDVEQNSAVVGLVVVL